MTFLCLFVVLAALFITVFNSNTTNHISVLDQDIKGLTKKNKAIDTASPETVNRTLSKPPEAGLSKKKTTSQVLPTFS